MKRINQFKLTGLSLLVSSFILFACNNNKEETTEETNTDTTKTEDFSVMGDTTTIKTETANHAMATLSATGADTALSGTVEFNVQNGKVKMTLNVSVPSMANKTVAVHLHEMGDCGDMGHASHGHWNPTEKQHGKWGSGSFHAGDIGNVKLDGTGKGMMELETDQWTIGGDATTNILNKSVIVHSGTDDYKSQPSGNAGSRIGCGVIK